MKRLVDLLFNPPPMPEIELPIPARLIPGIKTTIGKAFVFAYERGVWDGFVAGVLLTLILVPTIRGRVAKGAENVIEQL